MPQSHHADDDEWDDEEEDDGEYDNVDGSAEVGPAPDAAAPPPVHSENVYVNGDAAISALLDAVAVVNFLLLLTATFFPHAQSL